MDESSNEAQKRIMLSISTDFPHDVIRETLKLGFINQKHKISDDSVDLMSQIAKIIAVETCARAAKQATNRNETTITLSHIESILPQLLLDFP